MENIVYAKLTPSELEDIFPNTQAYIKQTILAKETVELSLKFGVGWYRVEPEIKAQYSINNSESMSDEERIRDFITKHCRI